MVVLMCIQRYITPAGKQYEKGDLFRATEEEAQFLVVALGGEHFAAVPESLTADLMPALDGAPVSNDVASAPADMAIRTAPKRRGGK